MEPFGPDTFLISITTHLLLPLNNRYHLMSQRCTNDLMKWKMRYANITTSDISPSSAAMTMMHFALLNRDAPEQHKNTTLRHKIHLNIFN